MEKPEDYTKAELRWALEGQLETTQQQLIVVQRRLELALMPQVSAPLLYTVAFLALSIGFLLGAWLW